MTEIDAHCHFWRLDRGDYGWLEGQGGVLEPLRRDFTPGDYPADGAVIAVQAADSVAETEYLLDLAARDPRIIGVVGWVDLAAPDAPAVIARLARNPTLRGIRPMLQDIADTDWLLTGARGDAVAAMCDHGLTFDALITARHLDVLARFADAHPALPIVIDHAAKPQPGDPTEWRRGMARLSGNPRIMCKLSGLMTELPAADIPGVIADLLTLFGPDRLIWGSDWPVVTLAAALADWRAITDAALSGLPDADRAAIMGGNAARFYGVTP
ncbi:amidohydrolase [Paracoccus sp. (in: a-proteobacteria)]|uniref:amidohydrolase family protein n=1 Tax=Paracoccus sp. TaxID=267 RepID=UPI0026DEAAE3|nr:amidohydrolase family protein [Paracoccus sp. (in: a-proteobacteria)]MDO5647241.1 amidohydrolase family protein [Paracoccus sp. (in: a-proteobacteria)]